MNRGDENRDDEITQLRRRVRELECARALGPLAAGIVHDLNNHLGVAISIGEQALMTVVDPDTRSSCRAMMDGAQRGAAYLDSLRRAIRYRAEGVEVVSLRELGKRLLEVVEKARVLEGGGVEFDVARGQVRCVAADAFQALLHSSALLRRIGGASQAVVGAVEGDMAWIDVRTAETPVDLGVLGAAFSDPERPWLEASWNLCEDGVALLMLWPLLRAAGADLAIVDDGVRLRLPVA